MELLDRNETLGLIEKWNKKKKKKNNNNSDVQHEAVGSSGLILLMVTVEAFSLHPHQLIWNINL